MYDIIELNKKLVTELRDIAKGLDIKKSDKLKKEELVYQILDQQAINPPKAETKPAPKKRVPAGSSSGATASKPKRKRMEKPGLFNDSPAKAPAANTESKPVEKKPIENKPQPKAEAKTEALKAPVKRQEAPRPQQQKQNAPTQKREENKPNNNNQENKQNNNPNHKKPVHNHHKNKADEHGYDFDGVIVSEGV